MFLLLESPDDYWSEIIAAADPEPFRAPRYVNWPSVADTTRTNWLAPETTRDPPHPLTETTTIDVGAHLNDSPLQVSLPPPLLVCPTATPDPAAALKRHSFTAIAAPTPVSPDLYTTTICAPGVPPPELPRPQPKPNPPPAKNPKKPKKRGRPVVFDELKRAQFLGMVKAGFTIRHAARRVGVSHVAVHKARDADLFFAAQLARAEQERDQAQVAQIQNAGQKSWRAAAWLLERNEPKEYSLKHKTADPWSRRGQRRLKNIVAGIVNQTLIDYLEVHTKGQIAGRAVKSNGGAARSVDDRIAEIEAQLRGFDPSDDDSEYDDSIDAELDDAGPRNSEEHDQPARDQQFPDPQSNAADDAVDSDERDRLAADEAYYRLRSLLRGETD